MIELWSNRKSDNPLFLHQPPAHFQTYLHFLAKNSVPSPPQGTLIFQRSILTLTLSKLGHRWELVDHLPFFCQPDTCQSFDNQIIACVWSRYVPILVLLLPLFIILLPHWCKISRQKLVPVPNYWTWTKSTLKNLIFQFKILIKVSLR